VPDDEDLLAHELSWVDPEPHRDHRWLRTRPAGTNVMFALTGVFALVGISLYLSRLGPVDTQRGLGSVVAFGAVAILWCVVSHWLSRRLWIAIGPGLRAALRPIGVTGPLVTALILLVVWGTGWAVLKHARESSSIEEFLLGGPLEGDDWRVTHIRQGNNVKLFYVSFLEAKAHCVQLGPGWRLPRHEDAPFLDQRLKAFVFRKGAFHTVPDDPAKTWHLRYEDRDKRFRVSEVYPEHRTEESQRAAAVCIRDGSGP
jgi:hypothetical protein